MAETIRFNPRFTNADRPANRDAVPDWNDPAHKRYFPTDRRPFPCREGKKSGIVIHWTR